VTGRIELDPDVMLAVSRELAASAADVPGLVGRAIALQAGYLMSPLGESGAWAAEAAVDLQNRVDLLARADQLDLTGLTRLGFSVQDVAANASPVLDSLLALDTMIELQAQAPGPVDWSRRPLESIDDYVSRMIQTGIDRRLGPGPTGRWAGEAYQLYGSYNGTLVAGAGVLAAAQRFNLAYRGRPWVNTLAASMSGRVPSLVTTYLTGLARSSAMTAPFTASGLGNGQAVRGLMALRDPAVLTTRLADAEAFLAARGHPGLAARVPSIGPLVSRAASTAPMWFGRAWTAPGGATVARGATNLLAVARVDGLRVATSTAGAWRGLGIVGGVAATALDGYNLYLQGNPVEAFQREGAGYVADVARTGFNVSLTAAMIAPNPVTWGAVAITGVVWAGAEIVDNWPAISSAAGEARDRVVDWGSDRLDDAGEALDDVRDTVGDLASAAAESPANPMNWF